MHVQSTTLMTFYIFISNFCNFNLTMPCRTLMIVSFLTFDLKEACLSDFCKVIIKGLAVVHTFSKYVKIVLLFLSDLRSALYTEFILFS